MNDAINIYQMYVKNECRMGFYVRKDSWHTSRFAKVVEIQWVEDGKRIKGEPPYFGGFKNPPGQPRAGKIMGPRLVTLEAEWFEGGRTVVSTGGNFCWTQVHPYPEDARNTNEDESKLKMDDTNEIKSLPKDYKLLMEMRDVLNKYMNARGTPVEIRSTNLYEVVRKNTMLRKHFLQEETSIDSYASTMTTA
jgi:hypothetical protein